MAHTYFIDVAETPCTCIEGAMHMNASNFMNLVAFRPQWFVSKRRRGINEVSFSEVWTRFR